MSGAGEKRLRDEIKQLRKDCGYWETWCNTHHARAVELNNQLVDCREQRDALRDASSRALTQLTGLTILMQDCAARDEVNSVYDGIVAALALCGD